MRPEFYYKYRPEIADPVHYDSSYITVPAEVALMPYIRCFWGSDVGFNPHKSSIYADMLLIPDTCFDMIFIKNHLSGQVKSLFTGLNDKYTFDVWDEKDTNMSVFGIRFHFWALSFFTSYSMENTVNGILPPEEIFQATEELSERIFLEPQFAGRIKIAEKYLAGCIDVHKSPETFLACTEFMLRNHGVGTLKELSDSVCYSERQVQRIFINALGISPKRMMNLIRYQSIWQEMLMSQNVDYMSYVSKYNYVDQSHLIADFKRYHSMTPREAINKVIK